MKIIHVTPAYYPATYWGGPIFSVYALNNAFAALPGVDLKVLITDSAGPRGCRTVWIPPKWIGRCIHIFTYRIAGACVSAETGDAGNAHIFTQNFFAVAIK